MLRFPHLPRAFRTILGGATLLASAAPAAEPVPYAWTDAVAGDWSDATKWTSGDSSAPAAAGLATYELEFSPAGTYVANQDLNAGFLLNRLTFGGSTVTVSGNALQFVTNGASLPEIRQNGDAEAVLDVPLGLAADLSFGGTGTATVTLNGALTGNGALTKNGTGLLSLTGANSYRGNTTVNTGTLRLAQQNTGNDKSVVSIAAGATLDLTFTGSDTVATLVLAGTPQPDGLYDASNSGGAITGTGSLLVVTPPAWADAKLSSLAVGSAALSPAFSPLTGTYSTTVANTVTSTMVTPTASGEEATITVNGNNVASGAPSNPIGLAVGPNLITTLVRAKDGVTTRTYTVNVIRASAATVTTTPAVVIDATRATLNGSTNPAGAATVYFEYGPTATFGSRTPDRDLSGNTVRTFAAGISGLSGATNYHFRSVLVNPAGTIYGDTRQFTTAPNPPVAATGSPANITSSTATLVGAVNPNGVQASVYFEYGLTTAYGQSTPVQKIPAGFNTVAVQAPNLALIPGGSYHYRLVASNTAGTAFGNDVIFTVTTGGGSGTASAAPTVTTGTAGGVATESAILQGSVDANGGTTLVKFEYGLTDALGTSTAQQGIGNGTDPVDVALPLTGLLPGTTYHYRVSASNGLGATPGDTQTFTTASPAPTAVTGESTVLTTTTVRIDGSARARGADAEVWIDYGTDGIVFDSVRATPGTVSGDGVIPVSAELDELAQGVTYHYRVRAIGPGGTGTGETKTFDVESLSGLIQQFPPGVLPADRRGSVDLTLSPPDIGAGWRFAGEQFWRSSGVPATGLTAGDRVIEYRPVAGYTQPGTEAVAVASSATPLALARTYTPSATPGGGSVTVTLKPQNLTEDEAPARWKFYGEDETAWRESGGAVPDLVPGDYVILCKPVTGRATPAPVTATVDDGEDTAVTITYYIAEEPIGTPPAMAPFEEVSTDASLPNAFVGQVRSDAGSGTGFVVRPRVVVTVGHAVFDDGTLSIATGLQWLFQEDRDVHAPVPKVPRGHYLMTGYAAQRALDNSPGVSSPQSQNLDVATMFFLEDVGRGGFSGFLASDNLTNEFLLSDSLKTLAGYPIDGTPEADLDRMHATPPANVTFANPYQRTYTTSDIRASGGASGGPLCVLSNGTYYPAAVYLGGTGQTIVRAFDSDVVDMIGYASDSSGDGVGASGGGTSITLEDYDEPTLSGLKVVIEPTEAREAGAGWRLNAGAPYMLSGAQSDDLAPGTVEVSFPTIAGFVPPVTKSVTLEEGKLTTLTFTYESVVVAPVITSANAVSGNRGEELSYQITADHSPVLFTLRGVLPQGLSFDGSNGLISGTPLEAGVFPVVIGASNSGGADSRPLTITTLPLIANQAVAVNYLVPMNFAVASSESAGAQWSATGLPPGTSIHPSTGIIAGIPQTPAVYPATVTVTTRGASAHATVTITVKGIAPQITQNPVAARSLQYGTTTTLTVAATGLPEPTYQWYEGPSGDTDAPVLGATSALFMTPPVTGNTRFWARASSISGHADSSATVITVLPSSNANLIGLYTSEGDVSPIFNFGITAYTITVPNDVPAIQITPLAEVLQSTVKVANHLVPADAASDPVNLNPTTTVIPIDVTSGNGATTKRYTLTVTRSAPPSVATGIVTGAADKTATLIGTATPNGPATVFFQYGTTPSFGNATAGQVISGNTLQNIQANLFGLLPEVTYHYRIGLTTSAGTIFGVTRTFTTTQAPPLIATGQAVDLEEGSVKLVGAVDPNGTATSVYFEYGQFVGPSWNPVNTPMQHIPGGSAVVDIDATVTGLNVGGQYGYRLIGESTFGRTYGELIYFVVGESGSGTGIPTTPPVATTEEALDVTASTALLQGTVNPQGGTTFTRFEYGLTTSYGSSTPARGIGSGTDDALVLQTASGLLPGQTYHFRAVAFNSLGITYGEDRTFSTGLQTPIATTLAASPLEAGGIRVTGTARARGGPAEVYFEYGTDGVSFPDRVRAAELTVTGDDDKPITAALDGLLPQQTYYYRALAIRTGDDNSFGTGEIKSFRSDALAGLFQRFPREVDVTAHSGELQVNLIPTGLGKWRFVGEVEWRASGAIAKGLTTGDREIEFFAEPGRLQPGRLQPGRELVGIISGTPRVVLTREYIQSTIPRSGAIQVFIEPANRTGPTVPLGSRAQWRLSGFNGGPWYESGHVLTGISPGNHLVEFKAALDLDAPAPVKVLVVDGETRTFTFAYEPDLDVPASSLRELTFDTISTRRNLAYAYVGHLRTDTGSFSGFVVKPRVVATVAQALFDEVTLAQVPGAQWLFQRSREVHEPVPLVPRGFYVFDGYAAQREAENTPGQPGIDSQRYNAAAVYFAGEAGRGGYSGFLSTDGAIQPLATPTTLKTLVGYPFRGGGSTDGRGKMNAYRATAAGYIPVTEGVYGTDKIHGLTGMLGGPVCAQLDGGSYFPAGIYLGGNNAQNLVRSIDSSVIDLITRAEVTSNTGDNNTSGGISLTAYTAISSTTNRGALTVILEPAEARAAGALWKLNSEASFVASGSRKNNLTVSPYNIQLKDVPGFATPSQQTVSVLANSLLTVTITYAPQVSALASWRTDNFGTTANSGNASDSQDPDGDGVINIDEYVAGTDPNDATDVYRVRTFERTETTFSVTVPAKTGRRYILQRCENPATGVWTDVVTLGPPAANGDLTLTDPAISGDRAFYQVVVELASP